MSKTGLEDSLRKLQEIVEQMESSETSLEDGLKLFEKGVKLYKSCQKDLGQVEKKIKVLTEQLQLEDYND